MSDRPEDQDEGAELLGDDDLGEPVAELAELVDELPPVSVFARIRATIQRRWLVSDTLDFSVTTFLQTAMEYLTMIFAIFEPWTGGGDDAKRRKTKASE